ncbi:ABC transporter C family member [Trifolium repens]|nr:ABC transporter C family member [Trifolium repens]
MIEPQMGFEPLIWYCKPEPNSIWEKIGDCAFGSYTPCAINTFVISTSNVVLMCLCLYRIWLITFNAKVQRFCLISNYYNYILGMLASYCAFQPLLRLFIGNSAFNLNEETDFAPFEITTLIIESLTCSQ